MSRMNKVLSLRLDTDTEIQLEKAKEAFRVSQSSVAVRRAITFVADNFEHDDLFRFRLLNFEKREKAIQAFRDSLKSDTAEF